MNVYWWILNAVCREGIYSVLGSSTAGVELVCIPEDTLAFYQVGEVFPPYMNWTVNHLSGNITTDMYIRHHVFCYRWCQIIAGCGQSRYIKVSKLILQIVSALCYIQGSKVIHVLYLQDQKHWYYGPHRCRKNNDHREDALLLWLYKSIGRCVVKSN